MTLKPARDFRVMILFYNGKTTNRTNAELTIQHGCFCMLSFYYLNNGGPCQILRWSHIPYAGNSTLLLRIGITVHLVSNDIIIPGQPFWTMFNSRCSTVGCMIHSQLDQMVSHAGGVKKWRLHVILDVPARITGRHKHLSPRWRQLCQNKLQRHERHF